MEQLKNKQAIKADIIFNNQNTCKKFLADQKNKLQKSYTILATLLCSNIAFTNIKFNKLNDLFYQNQIDNYQSNNIIIDFTKNNKNKYFISFYLYFNA